MAHPIKPPQLPLMTCAGADAFPLFGENVRKVRFPRPAIEFSKTPSSLRGMAPKVGAHNGEVFREIGVSAEKLASPREKGVFG